ncbi:nuclear transport factor 2 family protein [Parvibaculum sp.]|uniref:nuclear transport factor 2 family protein n=1 Tax=Parvibaculum sp. TaxID=2024848 RepID=UPI001B2AF4CA|nr:nuclear transport factor 2 family protein [Parvibaculum sp.]MBO6667989.1 nuclear transport factor 2 family protein [Parvibaculum sp.]MBO6690602.1 nuclear transport factor 2 family protein [Parvibaculum sp.]MBO6714775.1 nuclear transport factor 2 family protein [Parvibaculum sp.]
MSDNEGTIRDFVNAWSRLDVDEIVGYFTEDGIYHNMMLDPVKGRTALKGFIGTFIANWSDAKWEIVNLVSRGDLVIAERVDRMKAGGKPVALPCCGVFEMEEGKIKVWRDYFDLATFSKAAS